MKNVLASFIPMTGQKKAKAADYADGKPVVVVALAGFVVAVVVWLLDRGAVVAAIAGVVVVVAVVGSSEDESREDGQLREAQAEAHRGAALAVLAFDVESEVQHGEVSEGYQGSGPSASVVGTIAQSRSSASEIFVTFVSRSSGRPWPAPSFVLPFPV